MDPRLDCRYYNGEKPCVYERRCNGCPDYAPRGIRVIVLKLGAMGDALRTTPLLHAIKRKFPVSTITWVTDSESRPILEMNPLIDELYINLPEYTFPLLSRRFDWGVCLDKDPSVTSLITRLDCAHRFGFSMSPYGTLDILNDSSRYALALGIDDDLKFFQNTKTYQQIIYEMSELPYQRDEYVFCLQEADRVSAENILNALQAPGNGPAIGLNTGCGDVFATKKWPKSHFLDLARILRKRLDARVYLLGGKAEAIKNREIESHLNGEAVNTGHHPVKVFAGLIKKMDALVAGDTMALHMALAVRTPVLGLFGPTCFQEIDFYDRGEAIVVRRDCGPCYRKTCKEETTCMHDLLPEMVFNTLLKYVDNREY
jgi:ADP-heptose:LPS heptosyltransferase